MILEKISVGALQVNCYILASQRDSRAIIIDPGAEARKIQRVLDKYNLKPALIINTHGHYDHIGADNAFNLPVYVHKLDAPMLQDAQLNMSGLFSLPRTVKSEIILLDDMQIVETGGIQLKVVHLPGHTAGGIGLLLQKPAKRIAFTGDTLFCQGVGRWDLAGGSQAALVKSIKEKLFILPDDTRIYPGHGPDSTIGQEKKNNLI
ncbi:MAG: MBL fold metallo-hydrolase [Candidatus Omnitrophica bacterium]|jgi:glyoxylase-like metal-dependent hydrolase (beta-lactamase superfamily II)|nr:MBL fold metallo-hydrolase [Candidatus Omnitrophota bacterium]MDD5518706.1 MBL fold metallo-hydrolase [Candidatus Omnitrophota bacterium]